MINYMKYRFKTEEEMQKTAIHGQLLESGWRGNIPYGWSGDMNQLLGKPLMNLNFKQESRASEDVRVGTVKTNGDTWMVHKEMVVVCFDNITTKVEEFTKENILYYRNMPIQIKGDDNGIPFMFSTLQQGVVYCHSDKITIIIDTNDKSAKITYHRRIDKKELVSVNKLLNCLFTDNISIEDCISSTDAVINVLKTDRFNFEMLGRSASEFDRTASFLYEPIKTKEDVTFF